MARGRTPWKTVNIPAEAYMRVKGWVESGESGFVSTDEACRFAIRMVLFGVWKPWVGAEAGVRREGRRGSTS